MSERVLQINFRFNVSVKDYLDAVTPLAADIADVPGLEWKVWLLNEAHSEAGGIYLFRDSESLHAYLDGPIVAGISSNPALSDLSAKVFDAVPDLCEITSAPLAQRAAA